MQVKIYQPTKNPMQSGQAKNNHWLMEFELENSQSIDEVMGWSSNKDTKQQLSMKFPSQTAAENYAKSKGYEYQIIQPNKRKLKLRTYSSNFTN